MESAVFKATCVALEVFGIELLEGDCFVKVDYGRVNRLNVEVRNVAALAAYADCNVSYVEVVILADIEGCYFLAGCGGNEGKSLVVSVNGNFTEFVFDIISTDCRVVIFGKVNLADYSTLVRKLALVNAETVVVFNNEFKAIADVAADFNAELVVGSRAYFNVLCVCCGYVEQCTKTERSNSSYCSGCLGLGCGIVLNIEIAVGVDV